MLKYDLLVYLGLVPIVAAMIIAAIIISQSASGADVEIRKIRLAGGALAALFSMFIFTAILYFVDPGGTGREIFDKAYTAILTLVGTIIGSIFSAPKK
jgi:uncharacterized membrane protein